MRVILHIGTDKTGSTSIQNCLASNRGWMAQRSVFLPATGFGRDNGHSALLETLDAGDLQVLASELQDAKSQGFGTALLCWEGMFRYDTGQITRLREAMAGFPLEVLIYVREQAEVIQSGHLQWIKMSLQARSIRSIAAPRGPLEKFQSSLFLRNPVRNYHAILRRWQRALKPQAVRVRVFDRSRLKGGDIIEDFLEQLGLDADSDFTPGRAIVNPSLDVEGALLIEGWKADPDYADRLERLVDVTQSVINHEGARTRYFLDRSAVGGVRRHFKRSNRKLSRDFMSARGDPFDRPSECWRTDSLEAIEARAADLSHRVWEVNCVPTLPGGAHGRELPGNINLGEGWSTPEDWGVWSVGERSNLRFRLLARQLTEDVVAIRVALHGRYHGDLSGTHVTVNGRALGERDLAAGDALEIPIGTLAPYEIIEITLDHVGVTCADGSGDDRRALAFALSGVSCELVRFADHPEVPRGG